MAVFGLDFGTTNSLVAYVDVEGDEAVPLLDRGNPLPDPSVLWYHGTECVAGKDAKDRLTRPVLGVSGDVVRSPKRYLGIGTPIHVAGRVLTPAEIVADFFRYLRKACERRLCGLLGRLEFDRAVLTIPVQLTGRGRQDLREAAGIVGIHVDQFVHEPLAALYGHLRSRPDFQRQFATLRDQVVLVFDWGGGTLDLTLCRFESGSIVQVQNLGNDLVGGDRFDERIVSFVKEKHVQAYGLRSWPDAEQSEGSRARLFQECEFAKIDLSSRTQYTVHVRECLRIKGPASELRVVVTREDLIELTRDLVKSGIGTIDRLLTSAGQKEESVAFCLSTGGMVRVPYVQEQLQQLFGISRVQFAEHGDRIIAQGAAWIAHDRSRACLAKPFEILDADNTYVPIVHAGEALPGEGQTKKEEIHFYCVDPRDGFAKLQFARPKEPARTQPGDPRQVYDTLTVRVDPDARPLVERLVVGVEIDENLVVHVCAESTGRGSKAETEIHDLEFGLRLGSPGERENGSGDERKTDGRLLRTGERRVADPGKIALRSNVTQITPRKDGRCLIPGEMIPPSWNIRRPVFTQRQRDEQAYYIPCGLCGRLIYQIRRDGCKEPACPESREYSKRIKGDPSKEPEGRAR